MSRIVADLLEALLQIKALAETPARVGKLLDSTDSRLWKVRRAQAERSPVEILAHLADAEAVFCLSIRLVLTRERPSLPVVGHGAQAEPLGPLEPTTVIALDRFTTRRRESLALLSACSAAQLERGGIHPARKLVSLADLVAIMLAHDTDHLGQIMERLGSGCGGSAARSG